MPLSARVDLAVPYAEKEDAKALGARFDWDRKVWYVPAGIDLDLFGRWLPKGLVPPEPIGSSEPAEPEKGMALMDLLAQVRVAVEGAMPEAAWVRAEVGELRGRNGHLYLTLVQRNERGDVLAQCKAAIWRSRAEPITRKFAEATGEGLRADIKILALAKARFDVLYGLDLIVEDVDPSYTLGDLAAKLARIRERLQREGLYDRNRGLPAPAEFVRVAVISPETSAGLGDFRREADRLQRAGLCDFLYYPATFQGLDAPASIRTAVNEALAGHRRRPLDALAIIRGGGSVTDLAWLDDLELARLLCQAPVPVLTGIGHERDGTILDEIAHRRFDTPSKVALHIAATIKDNALVALAALDQIRLQVARVLSRERTALATQADRLRVGARTMLSQAEDARRAFVTVIRTATHYQLRETSQSLDAGYARLLGAADGAVCEAALGLERSMESIAHRSEILLGERRAVIEKAANIVAIQATAKAEAAARELDGLRSRVGRDSTRLATKAADDLGCDLDALKQGANALVEAARREVEANTRIVVGLGPQATLRRGFAIARGGDGGPITSRGAAMRATEFAVQFHDGTVPVAVRESEGGGR